MRRSLALGFLFVLGSLVSLAAAGCDGKESAPPSTTRPAPPATLPLAA